MKPPIKLVPTIDVHDKLLPENIKQQIMGLRHGNGESFPWKVGETAKEVDEHGDDHSLVHQDGGSVDHKAIDDYLKSLGVKEGETISLHIWW